MNLFVVISKQIVQRDVDDAFPRRNYALSDHAWIVADETAVCAEVSGKLGVLKDGQRGVVTGVSGYYGLYDVALWQRMAEWGGE